MGDSSGRFVAIARILRPQGRKGEVAAEILTDFPERFERLRTAFLEAADRAPYPVDLERTWPHKGRIVLKFSGIDSIEDASRLRGYQVLVPWEQRAPIPPHHYYVGELIGCRVIRQHQGQEIGTVTEVESTGGVDVLHVKRAGAENEVLVPLAQEICTQIDVSSRVIFIDPPEDLLELNA